MLLEGLEEVMHEMWSFFVLNFGTFYLLLDDVRIKDHLYECCYLAQLYLIPVSFVVERDLFSYSKYFLYYFYLF